MRDDDDSGSGGKWIKREERTNGQLKVNFIFKIETIINQLNLSLFHWF